MVLLMARPWKHPESGFYYVRLRIPQDVRAVARGLKIKLPAEAGNGGIELGPNTQLVKASLRTRDLQDAKARYAAAFSHLSSLWKSLRDGPQHLSQKQIIALAGDFRRRAVAKWDDEPGPSGIWSKLLEMSAKWDEATRLREMAPFVAEHLARHALNVSDDSKTRLAHELYKVGGEIAALMKRRAEGYYDVDEGVARFALADVSYSKPKAPTVKGGTLMEIFEGWWREAKALGLGDSTHDGYKSTIKKLGAFLGHDDASRVTEDDVIAFKDHRLATPHPHKKGRTLSARTVKDGDLAALKSVFGWAKVNRKMAINPAEGVTMKRPRKTKLRDKWFSDEEARAILKAALHAGSGNKGPQRRAAERWVPWLMAYSGARVGEMVQLRKQDLHREAAHWYITITPEAGTVKAKEARKVVLHAHLVELGFVKFVQQSPDGHLFLRPAKGGDVRGPLRGVKNRLQEFVRGIVTDENVKPNHAWRDTFKKIGLEARMDRVVINYISGWTPTTVTDKEYPAETPKIQAAELAKFPRYDLKAGSTAA